MDEKEKQAWETILNAADMLNETAAAFLQGYAQGLADGAGEKQPA